MSYETFQPKIWAAKILKNLNDSLVAKQLGNTEYQEPLKNMGRSIVINSVGRPTIKTYDRTTTIDSPERLSGSEQTIDVDQEKYYNFIIPSIDEVQSKPALMGEYTQEAAWALGAEMDDHFFTTINGGVATANQLSSVAAGTPADLYEKIVDMSVKLDENNTPEEGRWLVVSPAIEGVLYKDDRFVSFGTDINRRTIKNEAIARIRNLMVYKSNRLPLSGTDPVMLAGYKGAFAYIDQMRELEAFKPQDDFGDALKELHVYGAKVIRPDNVVSAAVTGL